MLFPAKPTDQSINPFAPYFKSKFAIAPLSPHSGPIPNPNSKLIS